jgi:hypothetical protein
MLVVAPSEEATAEAQRLFAVREAAVAAGQSVALDSTKQAGAARTTGAQPRRPPAPPAASRLGPKTDSESLVTWGMSTIAEPLDSSWGLHGSGQAGFLLYAFCRGTKPENTGLKLMDDESRFFVDDFEELRNASSKMRKPHALRPFLGSWCGVRVVLRSFP